jgi:hypothetical protein
MNDSSAVYAERGQCVLALARAAKALGFPAGFAIDPQEGPDWPVLYIDLPSGQVSWHLTAAEREAASDIGPYRGTWDGHSTEEKYKRLAAWHPELPMPLRVYEALALHHDANVNAPLLVYRVYNTVYPSDCGGSTAMKRALAWIGSRIEKREQPIFEEHSAALAMPWRGVWRHFKGGDYFVHEIAVHDETGVEHVIYESLSKPATIEAVRFYRPMAEFEEVVRHPAHGLPVARFRKL